MARREKFTKRSNRRTKSGINPASILRPRKGQTKPSLPKAIDRVVESGRNRYKKEEEVSTGFFREESPVSLAPPRIDPLPNNVISTESSLPYLRNPYPDELGIDPSSNYTSNGGNIRLSGRFEENFLDFANVNVSGITECEGTTFNFLVQFEDGTLHTSPIFLAELRSEYSSANPYRNKNTVSVVTVDSNFLTGYGSKEIFDIPEQYAEVKVSDTINNKKDILYHINWLCGSDSEELRKASDIGSWNVETTEELGFDHSDALDILNGEEPSKSGGTVGQTVGTSESPVVTTDDSVKDPIPVNDVYPPFGYRGVRGGEVKTWTDGNDYIWKNGRKRFGRRGTDRGYWQVIKSDTTRTINPNSGGGSFPDPGKPIRTNNRIRPRPSGGSGRGRQRYL